MENDQPKYYIKTVQQFVVFEQDLLMSFSFGIHVAFAGFLLLAGVLSNKLASRFNMPILLMFLAVGMLVGSEGLGVLSWDPLVYAGSINNFGTIAMCFILFSGGLGTRYRSIRPVLGSGIMLATAGVLFTALLLGVCGYLIFRGFGFQASFVWWLLMASLISSTDAAAMFAILRGNGVNLSGNLQPLLELESGSNDPMAALLTIVMIEVVLASGHGNFDFWQIPMLFYRIVMGAAAGFAAGCVAKWLFGQRFEYEGLYYVLGIAVVLLSFSGAELIRSNGFLAVYVCGVTMGNLRFNYRSGLEKFNEGIAWLMQVVLFTSLGMLVNPSELVSYKILIPGVLMSLALMFIARPGAVFLSLIKSRFSVREKTLISWAGLRGAAPIVLATFPLVRGVPNSGFMFNMIFFMVIGSVLVQGVTLMPLARRLGLSRPFVSRSRSPLEMETVAGVNHDLHEFEVNSSSALAGVTLAEAKLPPGVLVTLIRRGKNFVPASGSSRIEAGDGLLVIGTPEKLRELAKEFFPGNDYTGHPSLPFFAKKQHTGA